MADRDVMVSPVGMNQHGVIAAGGQPGSQISKKPTYLVTLSQEKSSKTGGTVLFIALGKPDLLNGFIEMKGFFCDLEQDKILENPSEVVANSGNENQCEMMFPWHRVLSIRNLIFKAVKPNTLTK